MDGGKLTCKCSYRSSFVLSIHRYTCIPEHINGVIKHALKISCHSWYILYRNDDREFQFEWIYRVAQACLRAVYPPTFTPGSPRSN